MTFVKLTIMTLQYPVMLTFAMTGHNDFYIDRMTTKNDFCTNGHNDFCKNRL